MGVAAQARSNADLSSLASQLAVVDADAQWYLHPSKRLLLCGTAKSPVVRTSRLSLREMVTVIEELSHYQR
jgi:hypothetical protein